MNKHEQSQQIPKVSIVDNVEDLRWLEKQIQTRAPLEHDARLLALIAQDIARLDAAGTPMDTPTTSETERQGAVTCALLGLLGDKHTGMKISASGTLSQCSRVLKSADENGLAWGLEELSKHLHELGERFYAGDVKVVDEFLQLYCLADTRPSAPPQREDSAR